MFSRFLGATDTVKHLSLLLLVYVLSYLMVSNHRYLSFKQLEIKKEKKFQLVVFMLLFLILVATGTSRDPLYRRIRLYIIRAGTVYP